MNPLCCAMSVILTATLALAQTPADEPTAESKTSGGVLSSFVRPPQFAPPPQVLVIGDLVIGEVLGKRNISMDDLPSEVRALISECILQKADQGQEQRCSAKKKAQTLVARVNNEPILEDEIHYLLVPELAGLSIREGERRRQELRNKALQRIIEQELLRQDAVGKLLRYNPSGYKKLCEIQEEEFQKRLVEVKTKNHLTDDQFLDALRKAGVTMEQRKQIEKRSFFADEYLRSCIWPIIKRDTAYPQLLAYYEKHPAEFQQPDSVDWQDVFIAVGTKRAPTWDDARQLAKRVERRLRNGEPLERLLEMDDGDSSSRHGEGMGHLKGQIDPPALEQPLFKMKPGQVKTVKITTGYHVIRLARRIEGGPTPFSTEVREALFRKLANEIGERERKRIVAELRAKAVIEIVGNNQPNTSTH